MSRYQMEQESLRQEAIEFQSNDEPMSWGEILDRRAYFEVQGARYGLLAEFRAEGII